jgi:propionyl-CoA carboxylase beta chain
MTANDPVPGGSAERPAPDPHTTAGKLADLQRRRHEAVHAGPAAAVDKQHARGKLTARERIALLLDEGSFVELDELARHRAHDFGIEAARPYGDGAVTGTGLVDGRPAAVYSQDFTVFGGSLGEVYGEKIVCKRWTPTMPSVTIQDSSAGNPVSSGTRTVQPALES